MLEINAVVINICQQINAQMLDINAVVKRKQFLVGYKSLTPDFL